MDLKKKPYIDKIDNGKPITIKFYNNDKDSNALIRKSVETIFNKYKRSDLVDVIYFCIKELLLNAIMTNVKSLFFEKSNLNINNIADYVSGITQFKDMIERNDAKKYYSELALNDLWVKFNIRHSKHGIKFEITNNSPIVGIEERQIRMKLQKSMIYVDLLDYNNMIEYDPYDEKMGLALIAILLKKANLDVSLFRIGTTNGITLSRIEVPLTTRFRSSRRKKQH